MTLDRPTLGPSYDKTDPSTRAAWLEFRRGGLTATEVRDWGSGAKRRQIIAGKVTGEFEDLSSNPWINHGNVREPIIGAWVQSQFGITPTDAVFSHATEPRHLASPDGITLDPFSGELAVGPEAALLEIKTSKHDLTPGSVDAAGWLVNVARGSEFERSGYYVQMQWQMYVMNAASTLFVWEMRGEQDPESGLFAPVGPPQWAWIPRDQALIDVLVNEVAPAALADIDAARLANSIGELPPVSDLPSEDAALVAEYLASLDAEKIAAENKTKAWKALQERYTGDGKPDVSIDAGFARVTVSTTRGTKRVVDEDGMRAKARTTVERYEALRERFTSEVPTEGQRLTITRPKN